MTNLIHVDSQPSHGTIKDAKPSNGLAMRFKTKQRWDVDAKSNNDQVEAANLSFDPANDAKTSNYTAKDAKLAYATTKVTKPRNNFVG